MTLHASAQIPSVALVLYICRPVHCAECQLDRHATVKGDNFCRSNGLKEKDAPSVRCHFLKTGFANSTLPHRPGPFTHLACWTRKHAAGLDAVYVNTCRHSLIGLQFRCREKPRRARWASLPAAHARLAPIRPLGNTACPSHELSRVALPCRATRFLQGCRCTST